MQPETLRRHLRELALVEETSSPVVSCYLDLPDGSAAKARRYVVERARLVERSFVGRERADLKEAFAKVLAFIDSGQVEPSARGVALFARSGEAPLFKALQFRLPLPIRVAVDPLPNIYHLVELEDTYHRFVVVLLTETSARILEVNLGTVTETTWAEQPDTAERVGREWTRERYRSSLRQRSERFLHEQVQLVERLVREGDYRHVVLAGSPRATARFAKAVPKALSGLLVDSVPVSGSSRLGDIVNATLAAFVEQEQKESLAAVEKLRRGLHVDGLAVVGEKASREALEYGQVDTLVISRELDDETTREELVRLATLSGAAIETVADSYTLMQYGGVGCVLRYLRPEQHLRR